MNWGTVAAFLLGAMAGAAATVLLIVWRIVKASVK